MKKLTLTVCALALLAAFPVYGRAAETSMSMHSGTRAQGGMQKGMHDGPMNHGDMPMKGTGMMMPRPGSYSDRAFLSAMIPHHVGAIDMAMDVLRRGKNPQVLQWAKDVISAQEAEIKEMKDWLEPLGGPDTKAAEPMEKAMHGMMAAPMSDDPDRNFVEMMIGHHAGALEMATESIVKSENRDVLRLSRDILESQAGEIYEYKQWLMSH